MVVSYRYKEKDMILLEGETTSMTSEATSTAESTSTSGSGSAAQGAVNGFVEWWQTTWNAITNYFSSHWSNILKFFAILVVGAIIIWMIMFALNRIFKRTKLEPLAARFVSTIVRVCLLLLLVFVLLMNMGIEITGLTAAFSAIVLAIGVALRDNVANLANGMILVSSKKYKTGDYIVVGDVEGCITEINFLFTCLKTYDGKQIMMPNNTMVNFQVTNLGAYPTRRVQFELPVAYESDTELVKKVVTDVMKADGRIHLDPAPFCMLKSLGASSINFFCHCWVDNEDYWDVYYYLMETVYNELKRNGITVPYQQIEMRERKDNVVMPYIKDPLPPRVEKVRQKKKKTVTIEELEEGGLKTLHEEYQRQYENNKKEKKRKEKRSKESKPENEDKK